jgi:hypothetical protein
MVNRITALLAAGFMLIALLSMSGAAFTGVENITLSRYSTNAMPGQNLNVNFSLISVSGYSTFSTNFWVFNSAYLTSQNITIILSPNYGNPPTTGVMRMFIGHTTAPGTYDISLRGNSTNVQVNSAKFVLYIPSSTSLTSVSTASTSSATSSASTTAPATTSAPVSSSSPTSISQQTTIAYTSVKPATTVSQSAASNGGGLNAYVLVVLVVIIAIVAFLAGKGIGGKGKKAEHPAHQKA